MKSKRNALIRYIKQLKTMIEESISKNSVALYHLNQIELCVSNNRKFIMKIKNEYNRFMKILLNYPTVVSKKMLLLLKRRILSCWSFKRRTRYLGNIHKKSCEQNHNPFEHFQTLRVIPKSKIDFKQTIKDFVKANTQKHLKNVSFTIRIKIKDEGYLDLDSSENSVKLHAAISSLKPGRGEITELIRPHFEEKILNILKDPQFIQQLPKAFPSPSLTPFLSINCNDFNINN